jgi:hypothetical protein
MMLQTKVEITTNPRVTGYVIPNAREAAYF